ncbi:MAG: DUF4390 domain-containing protein [Desulfococcaceae bacterium]
MKNFISRKIYFFSIWFLLSASDCAAFAGARLADMYIANPHDQLLVFLKVKGAFEGQIRETILSGVPTTFSFFIRLDEVRTFWTDKSLSESVLTHTIKYNHLKNEFTIRRSWEGDRPVTVRSLDEAEKLMSEVVGYSIISLDRLEKGTAYEVWAMAKLSGMTLPFYLRILPVPPRVARFETEWYSIDFVHE